jgi:hypothetical protein
VSRPRIVPRDDALPRLQALEQSVQLYPDRATVLLDYLRESLEAWGFVRVSLLDEEDAASTTLQGEATFHIVPAYPHLQRGLVGTGYADPSEVRVVIGLIQSARVHT